MASAEPEGARQELETLEAFNVVFDGDKVKAFLEWAREHADRLYPDVGMRSYVVPPLFVHKHSMRYNPTVGADVLQEAQKSSPKGEKAHRIVAKCFSLLSPKLAQPIFLISGLEYDNLLKWVRHHPHLSPALPDAVENRGDIDIMLLHPEHGVVFIQVKAVGDNPESKTVPEVQKKIILGGRQLEKDENILRWVLQDLPEVASCHVTRVVALPNLTRHELASFWPPDNLDPASDEAKNVQGVLFLCKDDLLTLDELSTAEADADVQMLMRWWNTNVADVHKPLSTPFMKDLVSRYVGMLSAVEVYAGNNLRKEVRVTSDAVDVLGMMFRRILLNEQQLRILTTPCQRRYLSGPPGSGKTVILILKARQFVQQGGHVVVINMYRGAAGRAIGHFIREGVARFRIPQDGKKGKGKSKPRKKKGEDKANLTNENTSPPSPRKRLDTPPSRIKAEEMTGETMPPCSRTRLNTPPSRFKAEQMMGETTPPCSRKRLNTPPSRFKANQIAPGETTPPYQRKRLNTPPSRFNNNQATTDETTPPFPRKRIDTPPSRFRANQEGGNSRSRSPYTPKGENMSPYMPRKKQDSNARSKSLDTDLQKNCLGTPSPPNQRRGSSYHTAATQDIQMDLSDRVHSVDVDIGCPAFHSARFEADIRAALPSDVTPSDVMFVVDEIYVKEYWNGVLEVLDKGFPGCSIWCAGLYSRNPPDFEQEDLMHVLRCPPLVQKVLYAVDWVEERKTRYKLMVDANLGVYTAGLTPLCVRHKDHLQVSVTECTDCATELASLLVQGLGLEVLTPQQQNASGNSTDLATQQNSNGISNDFEQKQSGISTDLATQQNSSGIYADFAEKQNTSGISTDLAEQQSATGISTDLAEQQNSSANSTDLAEQQNASGISTDVARNCNSCFSDHSQTQSFCSVSDDSAKPPEKSSGSESEMKTNSLLPSHHSDSHKNGEMCAASEHPQSEPHNFPSDEETCKETVQSIENITSQKTGVTLLSSASGATPQNMEGTQLSDFERKIESSRDAFWEVESVANGRAHLCDEKPDSRISTSQLLNSTASHAMPADTPAQLSSNPDSSTTPTTDSAFSLSHTQDRADDNHTSLSSDATSFPKLTQASANNPNEPISSTTVTNDCLFTHIQGTPTSSDDPAHSTNEISPTHTQATLNDSPASSNGPFLSTNEISPAHTQATPTDSHASSDAPPPFSTTTPTKSPPQPSAVSSSDVVMLVNIPRDLYEPDERGYLDTTMEDFVFYMKYLDTCPLVTTLRKAGVPVKVVAELPCYGLYDLEGSGEGKVVTAWAYAYQGLENKVVVYLPGDTPWRMDPYSREIPAPGLRSNPREVPKTWKPVTMQKLGEVKEAEADAVESITTESCAAKQHQGEENLISNLESNSQAVSGQCNCGLDKNDHQSKSDCAVQDGPCDLENDSPHDLQKSANTSEVNCQCDQKKSQGHQTSLDQSLSKSRSNPSGSRSKLSNAASESQDHNSRRSSKDRAEENDPQGQQIMKSRSGSLTLKNVNLTDYWWNEKDVSERYSNWDKSNLFVAGSRCLSQLIMIIP